LPKQFARQQSCDRAQFSLDAICVLWHMYCHK
jgi:hypothetical protein